MLWGRWASSPSSGIGPSHQEGPILLALNICEKINTLQHSLALIWTMSNGFYNKEDGPDKNQAFSVTVSRTEATLHQHGLARCHPCSCLTCRYSNAESSRMRVFGNSTHLANNNTILVQPRPFYISVPLPNVADSGH